MAPAAAGSPRRSGHSARAPRSRSGAGGGTASTRHQSPPCPHLLPGHSQPRGSPAPVPVPVPGQVRPCGSAGAARGAQPGRAGRTVLLRLAALCRGSGRAETPARPPCPGPAHLGVPLQAPRGRGICGAGGPAAPRPSPRIPLGTSARGALTSAHLSSPHRRGRPAPQEPRRSPPRRAAPARRHPPPPPRLPAQSRPRETPTAAPAPDPRRQPGAPLPREPLPPRPRGPAALAEQKPSRSGCGQRRGGATRWTGFPLVTVP
ncbi:translation initiation factor IF-2-like [Serinus canaria]|uniref:translation initiation factor IF-2-like n=1 Tax=Serinus canaria TaxID=9135 RepID=UPI0021CCA2ED|nr:translation initiation factor IF-2-like [Serinus canaria]